MRRQGTRGRRSTASTDRRREQAYFSPIKQGAGADSSRMARNCKPRDEPINSHGREVDSFHLPEFETTGYGSGESRIHLRHPEI